MGGPDILPTNNALVNLAYPFYDDYKDQMPLYCQSNPPSYNVSGYDCEAIFLYARDTLHINYMFWNSSEAAGSPNFFNPDVIGTGGVVDTYPTFNVEEW
jgi:hypothetical protein